MNDTTPQSILLIEDNPGDRRLIKEMLNEIATFNYQLSTAETLKEGIELIKNNQFVLILLDLNLPDSTGNDTFDKVIEHTEQTPVVLVSGMTNLELSLSLIKKGAQDFIPKLDLNASLLSRTIEFAIERKKLLSELSQKKSELDLINYQFVRKEIKLRELKEELNKIYEKNGETKRYS
jgi:DNA-binding NtrC family response regulator